MFFEFTRHVTLFPALRQKKRCIQPAQAGLRLLPNFVQNRLDDKLWV